MEDMRPYDPAYLPGSHSPQLTCFPLANFFEILYNRIDMTGDLHHRRRLYPFPR